MYKFVYAVNHGNCKKGESVNMAKSTARALEAHKIGKMGAKVTPASLAKEEEARAAAVEKAKAEAEAAAKDKG